MDTAHFETNFKHLMSMTQQINDETTLHDLINRIVDDGPHDQPIHVLEVDSVVLKYTEWLRQMPRVKQYYAIKSNDTDVIVRTVALLGGGFDCASQPELERVLGLGVPPERLIYAQPSKSVASLKLARQRRIRTVFDNEFELEKIAKHYPEAELLLRFRYDSTNSKINLGTKFGCNANEEAHQLLDRARELGMNVIGWCFNVGSMSYDAEVFYGAIRTGRCISDYAASIGFQFRVLDIGGGFVGDKDDNVARYADYINRALDEFYPDSSLEVFAEPGRYLCAAAVTNIAVVQGKRYFRNGSAIDSVGYYLNDGIYGTFYGAKYRGMEPKMVIWKEREECGPERESKLFGPTCDGNDFFMAGIRLPELNIGDALVFDTEGAYTTVHSCRFNGFMLPKVVPYIRHSVVALLQNLKSLKDDVQLIEKALLNDAFMKTLSKTVKPLKFCKKIVR
uniref:ornithine decarboxylase n=1 Tax=Anopheles funestus TaxID=62324 RepID=A0A182R2W0_ANOFN